MPSPVETTAEQLQQRYNRVLRMGAALLLLAIVTYGWMSLTRHRDELRAEVSIQAEELQLALNGTIDVVRAHGFAMRRAVENRLVRPGPIPTEMLKALREGKAGDDDGALHVDPAARLDTQRFQRDLAAATAMSRTAAAAHQWNPVFQWSYYYDAGERWYLIYPVQSRDELLRATATRDLGDAIRVLFDADGTRPVPRTGPRNNPQRDMVWTPPYKDASGKGMMVSLLAPVYLADDYVGAVGTDVTLAMLDSVLAKLPLAYGRALVVDGSGMLLADSGGALRQAKGALKLVEALPGAMLPPAKSGGGEWQSLPLKGTTWTLLVNTPDGTLLAAAAWNLRPYFVVALTLFLLILVTAASQNRRFSWPALRLAGYAEKVQDNPGLEPPNVPAEWLPAFARLATAAKERQALLEATRRHADELEQRVAERTASLTRANEELAATVASLRETQHRLVRADRLGNLGGLVAGVAHELSSPIGQAGDAAGALRATLAQFREQQKIGLRRADLDDFLVRVDDAARAIAAGSTEAKDLVQRFRQLAVDRNSEQAREFRPRELLDDVLAVKSAELRQANCSVRNDVPADLSTRGLAGGVGQLLTELVEDALRRAAKAIVIAARWDAGTAGEAIELAIEDDGSGATDGERDGQLQRVADEALGGTLAFETRDGGRIANLRVPVTAA